MQNLTIKGKSGDSQIIFSGSSETIWNFNFDSEIVIITDDNLFGNYKYNLENFKVIVIPNGEENKSSSTLTYIYDQLINFGADRKTILLGLGGGVVTDIAGFAASTFMRGLKFGLIPTSLLAMIDASIGGKNGVNHGNYKNMIGTITQPDFVMIEPDFLRTLPSAEMTNGFAEAIKHLLISDKRGFEKFDEIIKNFNLFNRAEIMDFLFNQIRIKTEIVNKDEQESGERKKLNFGHTFGHPLETLTGLKHGFAVSIGMVIAAKISQHHGFLNESDVKIISDTLQTSGLPVKYDFNKDKVLELITGDKKKNKDHIDFIMLKQIGEAIIVPVKIEELVKIFLEFN